MDDVSAGAALQAGIMTTRPLATPGSALEREAVDPFHLDDVTEAESDDIRVRRSLGLRMLAIALEPVKYAFLLLWLLAAGLAFVVARLWLGVLRMRLRSRPVGAVPSTRPVAVMTRELPRAA